MSKPKTEISISSQSASLPSHTLPTYRIGDLVWCQEARNNKLWWPAMVTYDPHLGIFFRISKQKCLQYHVQYFGISAIRGWVASKSCVPYSNVEEKPFNEKGLSKKVKAEYEVAIQEVTEAGNLDLKQRKLKFIFSFSPSCKGSKKSKQNSSSKSVNDAPQKEKASSQVSKSMGDVKTEDVRKIQTSRRSSKSMSEIDTAGASASTNSLPGRRSSRLSVGGASKSKPSEKVRPNVPQHKGGGNNSNRGTPNKTTIEGDSSTYAGGVCLSKRTNGLWDSSKDKSDTDASHPSLHSQHYTKPCTRRRASVTNSLDCEECIEYINKSDGKEMKCTSQPEVLKGVDMEACSKPIFMYMQKEYSDTETFVSSSKRAVSPRLNRNPLTKGASTKNVSTDLISGRPKRSCDLVTQSSSSGGSCGEYRSSSRRSVPPSLTSSESDHDTGRKTQPLSANRKRKRRVLSSSSASSSSVLLPSPLIETHSVQEMGALTLEEVPSNRKRKQRNASSSSAGNISSSKVPVDEIPSESEDVVLPVKRIRRANTRYSEQASPNYPSMKGIPSSSKKGIPLNLSLSCETPTSSTLTDSCSEISASSRTSSMQALPTFSSDADGESDHPTPTSSSKAKKKPRLSTTASMPMESKLRTCSICDCEDTDLLTCIGVCMNSFHLDCLGIMERPTSSFLCDECLISTGNCFVCGKLHGGELRKCSKPKCSKLYHLDCIKDNKLFQFGKSSCFTCPLHTCAKCSSIGVSAVNSSTLLQCIKCPFALHKPDCLVAGCEPINSTHMVCYQHVVVSKNAKLYSHVNLNTCLECGSLGSLYCCDMCSAAYHLECLDEESRPDNDASHWRCPNCAVHDLPTYGSLVITKFGVWR